MTGRQDDADRRAEGAPVTSRRRSTRVRPEGSGGAAEFGSPEAEAEDELGAPHRRAPSDARRGTRTAAGPVTLATVSQVLVRLTTRRAALLALVVCALALSTAVPLRTYLAQRADLQDQLLEQQQLRSQLSQLEQRQAQLSDPAAAEAEIRTRLRYVMPGETPYVVQLPEDAPAGSQDERRQPSGTTWYGQLWGSIVSGRS